MSSKGGRKTIMTSAVVQKLEQALRDGFSIEMACYVSGISRSTYYAHLQADKGFSDKMSVSQTWATQRAKQVVIQAIDKGDIKAAQWWLERRARDEFAANPPSTPTKTQDPFADYNKEKLVNLFAKTAVELYPNTRPQDVFSTYPQAIAEA